MRVEEGNGKLYLDALPEEAIEMSRTGVAFGYDIMRWGEKAAQDGNDFTEPVVRATARGVQFLVLSDKERTWVEKAGRDRLVRKARREVIRQRNWRAWDKLSEGDRDFVLSLLWVPDEPITPLEVLAKMAL